MIDRTEGFFRMRTLQLIVLIIFAVIIGRVAFIQFFNADYKRGAARNVMRVDVQYPPRGEIFDRRGAYLAQSRECYDLMVVYRDMDKAGFDTMRLCQILNMQPRRLKQRLDDARAYPRAPQRVANYVSKEEKLRLDAEGLRGFYTVSRTVRHYPLLRSWSAIREVRLRAPTWTVCLIRCRSRVAT